MEAQHGGGEPIDEARPREPDHGALRRGGFDRVVEAALPMRAAAGAPKLDLSAGAGNRLVELTVAVLGFAAGDPASTLTAALERWRPHAPSAEAARADLAAVRATLADRLAGPTPRLDHLLDVLIETETARRLTGATDVDPLAAFVPQGRTPPRRRPSRARGGGAGAIARRRRPVPLPGRGSWGLRGTGGRRPRGPRPRPAWPLGPVVAAGLMALTGALSAHPGTEALMPDWSRPRAPSTPAQLAPAPPVPVAA